MFNPRLLKKIPLDIIINEIIPFTYRIQPSSHLHDIRSFYSDMNLIENMFYEQNDIVVLNDLIRFCNNFISPVYDITKKYENILRRHQCLQSKTKEELRHFVFYVFHRNLLENTVHKIKFLFGLLTPNERTRYFNHFYIDDE